jgi:dipeptidyl aminopeptidase/acylaminoacyl peptidase
MKTPKPCGSWSSSISADMIAGDTIGLEQIVLDGDDIYWLEKRPTEDGRQVIVRRRAEGTVDEVLPSPYSARSRVHEYGGGSYTVDAGTVYFVDDRDQGIHVLRPDGTVAALSVTAGLRHAEPRLDPERRRLIVIGEDHSGPGEPNNFLAAVGLDGGGINILHEGHDFYASASLSPDGTRLAWLTWDHPDMPWDATTLWLARVDAEGRLHDPRAVAGGGSVSIFQPQWSPDGKLYFVSDASEWWNLHRLDDGRDVAVCELEAEFGLPQWVFAMSTWGFDSADRIVCASCRHGLWSLGSLCTSTGELQRLDTPYDDLSGVRVGAGRAVFLAGSATSLPAVASLDLETRQIEEIKSAGMAPVDEDTISRAEPVEFPTADGMNAYGFFYPPANDQTRIQEGELPPVIVMSHGGPTACASPGLNLKIQFWTSRGFAVLDVNYGGSTGYGRRFRERLRGTWGVVDVSDCVDGVDWLIAQGKVDPARLIIRGGSAGGYTTLCALTFTDRFRAGASLYGIGDLETLATDTHKFESRYLDRLIGPWPEARVIYRERSPRYHAASLSCPVIFLHGLEDRVVPPRQAEDMVEILRAKGVPVAYLAFPGEQHGFRRAETIRRSLEAELYFYSRVFGFALAENIEPVEILNAPSPEPKN